MRRHEEQGGRRSAEVERLLGQTTLNRRVRERLEMVKAQVLGQDVAQIARWSGRTVETVRHWLRRYQEHGVAGLRDAPRSGRPRQADAAYRAALEQAVSTPHGTWDWASIPGPRPGWRATWRSKRGCS